MKKCKCGNDCARNAKSCPKCGYRFTSGFLKAFALSIFGFILLAVILGSLTPDTPSQATQQSPQQNVNLNDAEALDKAYGIEATSYCASGADEYLRSVAKYDFKWDDVGFLESKFDKFRIKVPAPGVLVVISDKAKLQNGFGAYQHVELRCSYDTQSRKVLSYSVNNQ